MQAIADELAAAMGLIDDRACSGDWLERTAPPTVAHPYGLYKTHGNNLLTLDFVANALPEGWEWSLLQVFDLNGAPSWSATATDKKRWSPTRVGPDEWTARARCAIVAWKAVAPPAPDAGKGPPP